VYSTVLSTVYSTVLSTVLSAVHKRTSQAECCSGAPYQHIKGRSFTHDVKTLRVRHRELKEFRLLEGLPCETEHGNPALR